MMKRVFIAIRIRPGEKLGSLVSSLKSGLRDERVSWTATENLHVTLAFLGDTGNDLIREVGKMLENVCSESKPVTLTLRGAGLFKSLADPRVIWAGLEGSKDLTDLQEKIKSGLRRSGVSLEERPFSPHLTLGRIKSIRGKDNLKSLIESHKDEILDSAQIDEVIFYESLLMQTGAVYKPLGIYKLGNH